MDARHPHFVRGPHEDCLDAGFLRHYSRAPTAQEPMPMFTLEIDGTAVAVINGDEETARDLFTCDGFKDDIRTMTSGGKPLWNGTSALTVRAAREDEVEVFEDALAEDDGEEEFEPDAAHGATQASNDDESGGEEEDEADIVFLLDIDEDDDHLDS